MSLWFKNCSLFLFEALKTSLFSDLDIRCKGGEILKAHKLLFAHHWFYQNSLEADTLILSDYDVNTVACLLKMIYTGEAEESISSFNQVLKLAENLGLTHIQENDVASENNTQNDRLTLTLEDNLSKRFITDESKAFSSKYKSSGKKRKRIYMSDLSSEDLTCSTCGKVFVVLYKLKLHELIHSVTPPFVCSTCGKGFNNKYKMNVHEKEHGVPLRNESSSKKCKKNLKAIDSKHKSETSCSVCGNSESCSSSSTCSSSSSKSNTSLESRDFKCELCPTVCHSKKNLSAHLLTVHSTSQSHICSLCDKGFIKASYLEDHVNRFHVSEKAFSCCYCPKKCSTSQDLRRHHRSHEGESSFECSYCSLSFAHRSTLTFHIRKAHTGVKPYVCLPCGKRFRLLGPLKKHQLHHERKGGQRTEIVTAPKGRRGCLSYIDFSAPPPHLESALLSCTEPYSEEPSSNVESSAESAFETLRVPFDYSYTSYPKELSESESLAMDILELLKESPSSSESRTHCENL